MNNMKMNKCGIKFLVKYRHTPSFLLYCAVCVCVCMCISVRIPRDPSTCVWHLHLCVSRHPEQAIFYNQPTKQTISKYK